MIGHKKKREGCWTCRLRRKKCDEAHPVCRDCASLAISCYYDVDRPIWMDGADQQMEMAERVKAQIRSGATGRREKHLMHSISTEAGDGMAFIVTLDKDYAGKPVAAANAKLSNDEVSMSAASTTQVDNNGAVSFHVATVPLPAQPLLDFQLSSSPIPRSLPLHTAEPARSILDLAEMHFHGPVESPAASLGQPWETDFVMMYLDYVFPFIFPYYHPPLVGTGRAWLLTFLRQSDAVFHSALSLSSYFFILGLNDVFPGKHDNCKLVVWDQVLSRSDLSFATIQQDLKQVEARGMQVSLLERARLMESITQLLIFEAFLGKSANWELHLAAGLALLEDILKENPQPASIKPVLLRVLEGLAPFSESGNNFGRLIWNPDQAAFRFFAAALIYVDIVASVSLGRMPRLRIYHSQLLGEMAPEDVGVPLDISAFTGCQNWVLLALSEIAILDAWKRDSVQAGESSVSEMNERAYQISQSLSQGILCLDIGSSPGITAHSISYLQPYYHNAESTGAKAVATATRIWAHAASIYLGVVVSGWQPSIAEIRHNVAEVLRLLHTVSSAAQIRAMAWPICIAGCLAEEQTQQQELRNVLILLGDHQTLSMIHEARRIMETVWRNGARLKRENWDWPACFRILGSSVLLI